MGWSKYYNNRIVRKTAGGQTLHPCVQVRQGGWSECHNRIVKKTAGRQTLHLCVQVRQGGRGGQSAITGL